MSKRNKPDWLQDDVEQALKKAVRNHNAKVDRERKKDPNNPNIPDKVSYSAIKSNIRTKGGAQRQIRKLQTYTQRSPGKSASGGGGIQWRPEDSETLQKAVKNYNAKITRISKNDPLSRGLLPDKVTVSELRQDIKTRKDFNKKIRELQSYSQRGGEWQYNWTARDDARLSKAVDDFNAKLERLKKAEKDPKIKAALPDRASITQLKKWISTPEDLNRELRALRSFSKQGAEEILEIPDNKYNLKITRWQMEQMESRAALINEKRAQRRAELEQLEQTSGGKGLGYSVGWAGMGSEEGRNLDPIVPFTASQSRADLSAKYRSIMQGSQDTYWNKRDAIMKANYIKALENNFNPKDIQDIKDAIRTMTPEEFYTKFVQENTKFELLYPGKEYGAHLTRIRSTWIPNK